MHFQLLQVNKMKVFKKWCQIFLIMEGWNVHFCKVKEIWMFKKIPKLAPAPKKRKEKKKHM